MAVAHVAAITRDSALSSPPTAAMAAALRVAGCGARPARLGAYGRRGAACVVAPTAFLERRESLEEQPDREFGAQGMRRRQRLPRVHVQADPAQKEAAREMHALGTARRWAEALEVFSRVEKPDDHLRYQALRACTRAFQEEAARRMFDAMPVKQSPAYGLMAAMYSRAGNIDGVERLLDEMQARSLGPNRVVYTSLISAYGTASDAEGAAKVLARMEAEGLTLTEVEFGAGIAACGKAGDKLRAQELLRRMDALRLSVNIGHLTSVINACAPSGDEAAARAAFAELQRRGLRPDIAVYTSLASCARGPEALRRVRALREEMVAAGIAPNVFFFNSMLRAANEALDIEGFQEVFSEMERRRIPRNSRTELRIQEHRNLAFERQRQASDRAFVADKTSSSAGAVVPLPEGWQQAYDSVYGRYYYFRTADPSGSVTWERPA